MAEVNLGTNGSDSLARLATRDNGTQFPLLHRKIRGLWAKYTDMGGTAFSVGLGVALIAGFILIPYGKIKAGVAMLSVGIAAMIGSVPVAIYFYRKAKNRVLTNQEKDQLLDEQIASSERRSAVLTERLQRVQNIIEEAKERKTPQKHLYSE